MQVLSNGYMVNSDLLVLDRQVREGDAVSGWRGDPSFWVEVYNTDGVTSIWVMGRDVNGDKYGAASLNMPHDGWRHALLNKLVLGDWQKRAGDPVQRVLEANAKRDKAINDRHADYVREEFAPKLHWALVKDGHAQRSVFPMTPRNRKDVSHGSHRDA